MVVRCYASVIPCPPTALTPHFAVALSGYIWTQQIVTSRIMIAVTGTSVLFYLSIVYASLLSPDCPFQTPASAIIQLAWNRVLTRIHVYNYLCSWYNLVQIHIGSSKIIKKLRRSYIELGLWGVQRLASAAKLHHYEVISLICGCHPLHLPDQDIDSNLSMQSLGEHQVLELNIPVISTSTSCTHWIKWLIKMSSNPDVFLAAVSQVPDSKGLLSLHEMSDLNLQLRDTFMSSFKMGEDILLCYAIFRWIDCWEEVRRLQVVWRCQMV